MMQPEKDDTQQKGKSDQGLKAIKGNSSIKGIDAIELSLVPDMMIPHKFKMPDFEKYDESSCLIVHMTMFYRKMAGHMGNDKLLIHCFQESLT